MTYPLSLYCLSFAIFFHELNLNFDISWSQVVKLHAELVAFLCGVKYENYWACMEAESAHNEETPL